MFSIFFFKILFIWYIIFWVRYILFLEFWFWKKLGKYKNILIIILFKFECIDGILKKFWFKNVCFKYKNNKFVYCVLVWYILIWDFVYDICVFKWRLINLVVFGCLILIEFNMCIFFNNLKSCW